MIAGAGSSLYPVAGFGISSVELSNYSAWVYVYNKSNYQSKPRLQSLNTWQYCFIHLIFSILERKHYNIVARMATIWDGHWIVNWLYGITNQLHTIYSAYTLQLTTTESLLFLWRLRLQFCNHRCNQLLWHPLPSFHFTPLMLQFMWDTAFRLRR
jgi:hypothetical protein